MSSLLVRDALLELTCSDSATMSKAKRKKRKRKKRTKRRKTNELTG
jgi:hypothetical protein